MENNPMRLPRAVLVIFAVLACSVAWGKKDKPPVSWETAKVFDSALAKSIVLDSTDTFHSLTIQDNQLGLLGKEFAYVIEDTRIGGVGHGVVGITQRAVSNRHHGCRFIVGDEYMYWQEKAILHVVDADGKECKVDILRQERLQKPPVKQ
jgi:hypothetical protein